MVKNVDEMTHEELLKARNDLEAAIKRTEDWSPDEPVDLQKEVDNPVIRLSILEDFGVRLGKVNSRLSQLQPPLGLEVPEVQSPGETNET